MKNRFYVTFLIVLSYSTMFANRKDTLQYINEVTQVIENTAPSQISPAEWDGEWLIDEWQRTEYMPQEGVYTYYHEPYREAKISADESKRILEIMGYSITLGDATQTVINLSRQLVDNIYGTQDYVYGKLVLVEKKLYIHLRIIGTQDFSVDIYGIGSNNKHVTQASTWYGIRYVHDYPQKEHTPLITNLTYSLGSDTVIDGKLYRQIRYTHEYEHITNAYRGAIRQSEDGQQVYYIPWGSNNEYLLYNFDVKQGDIVHAYAGFNDISCEEMAEPGRSIIPAWTVMSVQTIDGRKHIFVQDEEYGTTIEWIEGIGTQYILWPFGRTCYATGLEVQFHHALCAADNEGNILYSFNTDDLGIRNECPNWQPMAIEHIHSDSPSVVKTLHDGHILILRGDKTYTLTGQEVK